MKKAFIFSLIACLSLAAVSCEDPAEIWEDNANPEVFIPRYGYTTTTVWDQTSGTFDTFLGVYCGGLRPANQVNTINVTFAIDDAIIDAYNADETSLYGGEVVALPKDCYSIAASSVTIEAGDVDAMIPISFDIAKVKAAIAANPGKRLVVPFKLTGTSLYQLNADEAYTKTMMEVDVQEPSFYFFCNNYGIIPQAAKLIYGEENAVYKFDVLANGVPDGNYELTFALDEEALNELFPGNEMIPADAVVLTEKAVYKNKVDHAMLEFKLLPEKLEFFKTYYLPISIKSASEYAGDKEIGTFIMTVEMKNEFEKTYRSDLFVSAEATDRTATYSTKKNVATYAPDILEVNIIMNNTIAGAKPSQTTATTYNNRYVRIKVIPTADKNHYDIEYIPVTDRSTKQNTPDTFEPVPDADNYYDWNLEKFVLNYRFKHIEKKDTSWVVVREVMQAI